MFVPEPTERELEAIRKWQEQLAANPPLTGDAARALENKRLKEKAEEYEQAAKLLIKDVLVLDEVTGEQVLPNELSARQYQRGIAKIEAERNAPVHMTESEIQAEYQRQQERLAGLQRIKNRDSRPDIDLGKF